MNGKRFAYWMAAALVCLGVAFGLGRTAMSAAGKPGPASEPSAGSSPSASGSGAAPGLMAQAEPAPPTTTTSTTTTTTTIHGGWTVTCSQTGDPPTKRCSAEFRVIDKDNKAVVLIWLLGRDKEGTLLSEFVTPSDILIRPGVAVTLGDEKPWKAEFLSCTTKQGCRASMELTPKLARDLKAATKAKIGLTLLNGKVMEIGMDIPGVDMALTDLDA